MTVTGFTMTTTLAHRGQRRRKVFQNSRSKEFSDGRGPLRFNTATCWCKASTSSAVSRRVLKKTRGCSQKREGEFEHDSPVYHGERPPLAGPRASGPSTHGRAEVRK